MSKKIKFTLIALAFVLTIVSTMRPNSHHAKKLSPSKAATVSVVETQTDVAK